VAQADTAVQQEETETGHDGPRLEEPVETEPDIEQPIKTIADPFEPINRLFFGFNDKLYFWFLKPVAIGYSKFMPEAGRVGVRNFFSNLATPIRFANCLLQFKFKRAGIETLRFVVNSTIGMLGFVDVARKEWDLNRQEEDFGQTLGFYGIGPIFYIHWPLLGPSSVRDTAGFVGDRYLDPWVYLVDSVAAWTAVAGVNRLNQTSLTIGEYESLKRAALDPYVSMRDAYHQFRQSKVKE
jgi:phospholipid-binding lipoprotein MlaA